MELLLFCQMLFGILYLFKKMNDVVPETSICSEGEIVPENDKHMTSATRCGKSLIICT